MELQRRLYVLSLLIVFVIGFGVTGFFMLSRVAGGEPSVLDCVYQTIITLTTLGSREMKPLTDYWYGELFVIVLLFVGMGLLFVFATNVTAFFVEGEIRNIYRRKKMDKTLQNMKNHIVVCGAGSTGSCVIEELLGSNQDIVIIESDIQRIQRIEEQHPRHYIPYVAGSATDDEILSKAGLAKAQGVVAALPDERDNLFITVVARQMNPRIKIVARAPDAQAELMLKRAGANAVVSPNRIGGFRMAAEIVRPQVVEFLDNMSRNQEKSLRIEEIPLRSSCSMVGLALRDTKLRQEADLLVLAIRDPSGQQYLYNPPPEYVLQEGSTLIVLGPIESVHRIRNRML